MHAPDDLREDDDRWMGRCLELAAQSAGMVSPNPMVGAVLVGPDGTLLGEGRHELYGGPHAEPNAIRAAEAVYGTEALRESTLYVNLEPCSHFGKTPPCADLILEKGIPRVVVGMEDPFPKVAGTGIRRLREHGVEVRVGVLEGACRRLNEAFIKHTAIGRPLVVLKVAQTLDGRVATATGDSRWVSGEASRRLVHRWRASMDAVLVGAGTALRDDPALTVRAVNGRQPRRVVLDREGLLPASLQLFTDAHAALTVVFVGKQARPGYEADLQVRGGRVLRAALVGERLDLGSVLDELGEGAGERAVQSVLVEAGPRLASALLEQDLVDRLHLFMAPKLVGDGPGWLHLPGIEKMADARGFGAIEWERVGEDMLFTGFRQG